MSAEEWLEMLNNLSEQELEELFTGIAVRLLVNRGRIVRVELCNLGR